MLDAEIRRMQRNSNPLKNNMETVSVYSNWMLLVTKASKKFKQLWNKNFRKKVFDLLINNAGIAYWEGNSPMKPSREKIMQIYNVNVAGVSMMTATFLTLLEQSTRSNGRPAKVMNLSSHLGSRPFNSGFAANNDFAYAASKAAVNMYSHLLAQMKKEELIVLSMAPGHVQTDMGGWDAPLTTDESIPKMLVVLNNAGRERSGEFLDYTGKVLEA
ncbi:hypothetical protein M3Y97_01083200 [Aphelenchoides bicaudatus]|nr:hypothetical protein M3Y97_01083200 [Aphelenchoides bicaudatus]